MEQRAALRPYLHELDEFVETLRLQFEKGKRKHRNPLYRKLADRKSRLARQGRTKTQEFQHVSRWMRMIPSSQVDDPGFIRIKYLRFADDWILGVWGSHALAETLTQDIQTFLRDQLHLTLNEDKTRITHARTESALFLGTLLHAGSDGEAKLALSTNRTGRKFKRRSTGWETIMQAPLPLLLQRLCERGFCTPDGRPTPKAGWAFLDVDQLILLYSSINRGLQNYYRFADNWAHVQRLQYILHFSLAMTLGRKFKIPTPQVFRRFGKNLTYTIYAKEGQAQRSVSFYLNHDWTKDRGAFQSGKRTDIDLLRTETSMRTRSKLTHPCCICGATADSAEIVMHHVRHIRKLSHKRPATGFHRILRMINRKQVPVCKTCHEKIHQGKYDSLKLSDLVYIPR